MKHIVKNAVKNDQAQDFWNEMHQEINRAIQENTKAVSFKYQKISMSSIPSLHYRT